MADPINRMRPVHPGEVLREDYLMPLGMSVNALALRLGMTLKHCPHEQKLKNRLPLVSVWQHSSET